MWFSAYVGSIHSSLEMLEDLRSTLIEEIEKSLRIRTIVY